MSKTKQKSLNKHCNILLLCVGTIAFCWGFASFYKTTDSYREKQITNLCSRTQDTRLCRCEMRAIKVFGGEDLYGKSIKCASNLDTDCLLSIRAQSTQKTTLIEYGIFLKQCHKGVI
ncbi:MAG: hypothetical protein KBT03_09660 [Bacteroidales bacterium]|nr:hypothetical protein [Candidatus Scybalousia scybalohippi]